MIVQNFLQKREYVVFRGILNLQREKLFFGSKASLPHMTTISAAGTEAEEALGALGVVLIFQASCLTSWTVSYISH
jgi:hypothetical protein